MDPVERAGDPGRAHPVTGHHVHGTGGDGAHRRRHQGGAVRLALVREQPGPTLRGQCSQQSRLAAGAGTQVEPALVTSGELGVGHGQRDQLRPFVLDAGPALGHRGDRPGVATAQHDAVRRQAGGCATSSLQLGHGGDPRPRHERDARRSVVGREQRLDLARVVECLGQRVDDPPRVGVGDGQVAVQVGVPVGRDLSRPRRGVTPAHLAQDGVDQPGRAGCRRWRARGPRSSRSRHGRAPASRAAGGRPGAARHVPRAGAWAW